MQVQDIQTALTAIEQAIGGRCNAAFTTLPNDKGWHSALTIYPNGMARGPNKVFEAADYATLEDLVQDAQDYAASYAAMASDSQIDEVALSIVNIHYAKGSVTWADLRDKHGPSVADCALTAVARANERLNTATPISIGA